MTWSVCQKERPHDIKDSKNVIVSNKSITLFALYLEF